MGLLEDSYTVTANQAITPPIALPTATAIAHHPTVLTIPIASKPPQYSQDSVDIILNDSIRTTAQPKGSLLTERAYDGQLAFFTDSSFPPKMKPS